jgi:hypothetical protein
MEKFRELHSMSYFAKVENGIVTEVIAITQENINSGLWGDPTNWIQTSYNTRGGIHYAPDSDIPDGGEALNMNYAGIGFYWDGKGFYAPSPYSSWIFDSTTYLWQPPIPYPTDGLLYTWDESTISWKKVSFK